MRNLKEEIREWRQGGFQREREILVAYWACYLQTSEDIFKNIPDQIDVINLAFANPAKDGNINFDCLTAYFNEEQLKEIIQDFRKKNIKVLLSLIDHEECQWNQVNLKTFIPNLVKIIKEWGFDGIDIHSQSIVSPLIKLQSSIINLITTLKKDLDDDHFLSYSLDLNKEGSDLIILKNTSKSLDWINLMTDYQDYETVIKEYPAFGASIQNRVNIGFRVRQDLDQDLVKDLVQWEPSPKWKYSKAQKMGIVLWALNKDIPKFNKQEEWSWVNTILPLLPKKKIKYY